MGTGACQSPHSSAVSRRMFRQSAWLAEYVSVAARLPPPLDADPPILHVPTAAALSHAFRACASGNVGAPLLMEASAGKAVQAGVLTGGFACSNSPSVASASSPALYTWLPQYGDWLADQLTKLRTGGSKAVDGKILQREEAAAQ